MGPRSHERGNEQGGQPLLSWIIQLQWGRVLMNAETTFAAPWGMRSVPASMGPRSHERGNDLCRTLGDAVRPRFNGAAFS